MKIKTYIVAVALLGVSLSSTSANQADNADDILDQIRIEQEAKAAAAAVAPRAVMVNPYDQVESIQRAQEDANRAHALAIEAMSLQTRTRITDADAIIKNQITRLMRQPADIDTEAALDLLNLDNAPVEVERIARTDIQRDYLVPSISMLQSGDTSIGEPENIFLSNWELVRDSSGETVVGRVGEPLSRIRVRVGMILGEYGRIMAVRDTPDAYYLVLESGDRIRGLPSAG
jgi:hypothetical protein